MTLLQIQYFLAVARTGNITNAADELYVSRPAISRAMRDLEQEFGIALFWRSNTGLALTEAGCAFYEACSDIQNRIDCLEEQFARIKEQNRKQDIRLGLTPLTGTTVFPKFYRAFRNACPSAHIVTMEHGHNQARMMLEDGSMDASFTTYTEGLSESVSSMELTRTQLVFCVSAVHPLAGRSRVSIHDIRNEPLVFLSEGMQREKEIFKRYRQIGHTPNVVLRMGQINALRTVVSEGIAAAILLQGSIDDGSEVIGIPFDPPVKFHISLIWNRRSEEREGVKAMLSFAAKWRASS
ncbi:MAG: LysR family transcriptional regulator [Oscillibacter sp.]|nr:LysR family transcriptional regulator [Oscillibacter sp.]